MNQTEIVENNTQIVRKIFLLFSFNRFLQAEAGRPWGHLSPSPRSPTRTPSLSPGAASTTSQHLSPGASPGGPSPTSPGGPATTGGNSRLPPQPKHRGRTSSMPAVPRHRVSLLNENTFFFFSLWIIIIAKIWDENDSSNWVWISKIHDWSRCLTILGCYYLHGFQTYCNTFTYSFT